MVLLGGTPVDQAAGAASDDAGNAQHAEEEEEAAEEDAEGPRRRDAGGRDGGPPRQLQRFLAGSHCLSRVVLYHGIRHWKRRLLAALKGELKYRMRLK